MRKKQRRLLVYAAVVTAALVVTACSADELTDRLGKVVGTEQSGGSQAPGATASPEKLEDALAKTFGSLDQYERMGEGYVVLSSRQNETRGMGYLLPSGGTWRLAGALQTVADKAGDAKLSLEGDMVVVKTTRDRAPQFTAFRAGEDGLEPVDYYAAIAPAPGVTKGPFLLVNKELNVLWHYEDGKLVKAYRVGTGRQTEGPEPTWQDFKTNFFTPEGTFKVTGFVVNPPYNALKPGDQSFAGGAPGNPLGTRWMGFSVLEGDGAGIWGIHGTSEPEKIGTWVSDGCIRLRTEQVEELYEQVAGRNPTLKVVSR